MPKQTNRATNKRRSKGIRCKPKTNVKGNFENVTSEINRNSDDILITAKPDDDDVNIDVQVFSVTGKRANRISELDVVYDDKKNVLGIIGTDRKGDPVLVANTIVTNVDSQEGKDQLQRDKKERKERTEIRKKFFDRGLEESYPNHNNFTNEEYELRVFQSDLRKHYNKIDKDERRGGMVQIHSVYTKMDKDYSPKEFKGFLLELEKERDTIDLQTASDPNLLKSKNREFLEESELSSTNGRGYINYVIFRDRNVFQGS